MPLKAMAVYAASAAKDPSAVLAINPIRSPVLGNSQMSLPLKKQPLQYSGVFQLMGVIYTIRRAVFESLLLLTYDACEFCSVNQGTVIVMSGLDSLAGTSVVRYLRVRNWKFWWQS